MTMNELLRRDVIRLIGLGGAGLMVAPGPALGQARCRSAWMRPTRSTSWQDTLCRAS